MSTRKKYDPKLKTKIVLELLKEEKTVSELASEHGIYHSVLIRWRDQAINGLPELLSDQNKVLVKVRAEYETKIESLYSEVGRLTSDLSWLKKIWNSYPVTTVGHFWIGRKERCRSGIKRISSPLTGSGSITFHGASLRKRWP